MNNYKVVGMAGAFSIFCAGVLEVFGFKIGFNQVNRRTD